MQELLAPVGDQRRQNQKGQKANQDEGQHLRNTRRMAGVDGGVYKEGRQHMGLGADGGRGRSLVGS